MRSLLLLDADVIIAIHKLGYWSRVINSCKVYVASVVVGEVQYYRDDNGKSFPIDLSKDISAGKIIELSGDLEEQSILLSKLKPYKLDGLDAGELESIAIICENQIENLQFCIKERLAIKVMAFLKMSECTVSIEQVLRDNGILKRKEKIDSIYSKIRCERILLEGAFIQVEEN
jgi:hypothetical protein